MRYCVLVAGVIVATCFTNVAAQFRPMQVPKGMSVPGETLIRVVVPEYTERGTPFSEALKHLSQIFGLRLGVRVNVSGGFEDPRISVAAKGVALREVINRVVNAAGFTDAEWYIDGTDADGIIINLGRVKGDDLLDTIIKTWSSPPGYSAEEVLANIFLYIPEMRQRVYGNRGFVGDRGPVQQGCMLVYSEHDLTAYGVIREVARISGKSWLLIYVQNDLMKSRIMVF